MITAAGVSAGIDMALHLVAREVGPEVAQAIQLGIEYDPQPPFDCGLAAIRRPTRSSSWSKEVAGESEEWLEGR